jgi:peptide-methionine (R)-S-oxide reductase
MKFLRVFLIISLCLPALLACSQKSKDEPQKEQTRYTVVKTEQEWRKILTPEQYSILREKGTERAFTGKYWDNHKKGVYACAACQLPLFSSETKFESGTGWPSFFQPLDKEKVSIVIDKSYGMTREEVVCSRCGGHLGHVFPDGPKPTGLRYCLNSASLQFTEKK